MVDAGEVFHPLRWTPREAFQLLTDLPCLEAAGVVVRVPGSWQGNRPARPRVTATVGGKTPSGLGTEALLDFRMELTLDGERLTESEVARLLAGTDGLALIRGQWVTVDRAKLGRMLDEFRQVERAAAAEGLSFVEAMRMLAGADVVGESEAGRAEADWSRVVAGPWLAETTQGATEPRGARVPGARGPRRPRSGRTSRWAPAGSVFFPGSASGPASPTTWAWVRRSRCSRCWS